MTGATQSLTGWSVKPSRRGARDKSGFVFAYSLAVASGFFMGLLCGWMAWG